MHVREAAGAGAAGMRAYRAPWRILEGDCRDVLATLPECSVHTCVTSPPYFGLRDYGTGKWEGGDPACEHTVGGQVPDSKAKGAITTGVRPGVDASSCRRCGARRVDQQIGLEPTPDEFVDELVRVFREVRRVLRDDGTVWLNLGSSYCSEDGYPLKPTDAAWLAGLIDGEGCIQIHQQRGRPNCRDQFQLDLSVGMMTSEAVQRAHAITGLGSCHQQNRGVWDWSVRGRQTAEFLRAIYPYLVTKRRQAALGIMLMEHIAEQRGNRVRPLTDEAIAYREALKRSVSACNQRGEPEIAPRDPRPAPLGVKAKDDLMIPHRVFQALMWDGWYGRSDIIWAKPNPMPESVTDRPTRSHEFIFLLSKGPRYFYDADAIREDFADERMGNPGRYRCTDAPAKGANNDRGDLGFLNDGGGWDRGAQVGGRNKRDVWTVSAKPYAGAHFATFPPDLIEPCVLAGCPEGGTVLDPFAGAGTTGLVAVRNRREFVGIELNPEYAAMARDRIETDVRLGHRPPNRERSMTGQCDLFDVLRGEAA